MTCAPAVRIILLPHYAGKVTSYCKLLLPDFSAATDSTLQLQITLPSSWCFSQEGKGIDHTILNPGSNGPSQALRDDPVGPSPEIRELFFSLVSLPSCPYQRTQPGSYCPRIYSSGSFGLSSQRMRMLFTDFPQPPKALSLLDFEGNRKFQVSQCDFYNFIKTFDIRSFQDFQCPGLCGLTQHEARCQEKRRICSTVLCR